MKNSWLLRKKIIDAGFKIIGRLHGPSQVLKGLLVEIDTDIVKLGGEPLTTRFVIRPNGSLRLIWSPSPEHHKKAKDLLI